MTYGNITWCSNSINETKKLFSKQRQAIKIIPMADIHPSLNSDEKMKHLDILNIYKLNLYQILNIMFRVKTNSIPEITRNTRNTNYSTRYSEYNFEEPNIFLGLLNLQYRNVDHVSRISILTNVSKEQSRCHCLKPKSKTAS